MFAADDNDARFGHMPSASAIGVEIVANSCALRNANVLIQDGATQLGMTTNVAVVHDNAAFDERSSVNANTASENGFSHNATGENATA